MPLSDLDVGLTSQNQTSSPLQISDRLTSLTSSPLDTNPDVLSSSRSSLELSNSSDPLASPDLANGSSNPISLLWRDYASGANTVWFMGGTNNTVMTSYESLTPVPTNWRIEGVADFNNDSRPDLLWRNYATGANTVWFMGGTNNTVMTSYESLTPVPTNWQVIPFQPATVSPQKPDLVIQSQYAPSSATVGDAISISAYTKNTGSTTAGSSYVRYWLSDDTTLNTSTDRFLNYNSVASLSAGSSEYDSLGFTYDATWGTGTKYILFEADGYGYVAESNESNNIAYQAITINAQKPDLVIQSQYAPSSATVGDAISISAYTKNTGSTTAGSSYVRYWLSDDTTLNTSTDRFLNYNSVASLSAGSSEYDSLSFTYDATWGTGTKYILFEADGYGYVAESNEANNVAYQAITINAQSYITVTTPNGGNSLTAGSGYYLYWNDNISENVKIDLYKGGSYYSNITTSTTSNGYYYWTLPSNLTAGSDYKLRISSVNNSSLYDDSDTFFNISQTTTIDLKGSTFSLSSTSLTAGNTVTAYFGVQNTGTGNAGSSNVKFYLSTDSTINTSDKYLSSYTINSLNSGLSTGTLSTSFTLPGATDTFWSGSKTYYIGMIVDADSSISESNESNNASTGSGLDYKDAYVTIPANSFDIKFDYRFDTNGWFTAEKKAALEAAASIWEAIILDDFADVPVGTELSVTNPQTGVQDVRLTSDYTIDDLVVFIGARDLDPGVLGFGGPSGRWYPGSTLDTRYNGYDFEPWTGSIAFDTTTNWFFDANPLISDAIPSGQSDFVSVAVHEIGHILGIGTAKAFKELASLYSGSYYFVGANATAQNGGYSLPLASNQAHIQEDHEHGTSGEVAMDPRITVGTRKLVTKLDAALLDDIGYEIDYTKTYQNP